MMEKDEFDVEDRTNNESQLIGGEINVEERGNGGE